MTKKSLTKNSLYNTIYCGFTVAFPLISITYFSRILMAEGIGKIEYARTVVTYFSVIATLGIPAYGVKIIAKAGNDILKRSRTFWEMFYLNFISTVICSLAYYIFITNTGYFNNRKSLFYIMGSLLIFNAANIDWYYQGVEDYVYITKRSIAIKIISFILMVIFVKNADDYIVYAGLLCLASAGNFIFNVFHLKEQIIFIRIKDCKISQHLKPVFILFASSIATEVYTMLDTVLIEYFSGEIFVGYYSNCVKIVRFIFALSTAMVATFQPRISLYMKDSKNHEINTLLSKGTEILFLFALPASIGLFLTSKSLIHILLGDSFMPSVGCLKILSILIIIFSFAYLLGHIVLIASGNESRILLATICGAIVNAVLNLLLIPDYKHYGAAIASVIAEALVTMVLLTKSRKIIKLNLEKSFFKSVFISLGTMTITIQIINFMISNLSIRFILCIFIGAVVYFSSLILLKNRIILEFYSKVKLKK